MQADRLLEPEVSDVDGNTEERGDALSVFNGPRPTIKVWDTSEEEIDTVSQWLSERKQEGVMPHEIGVFIRSEPQSERARAAVESAEIPLQERIETVTDDSDLEEVYNTERHLLYVACTRGRDDLLVTGVDPASEFLDDLGMQCFGTRTTGNLSSSLANL